jgi:hypothetical protein
MFLDYGQIIIKCEFGKKYILQASKNNIFGRQVNMRCDTTDLFGI